MGVSKLCRSCMKEVASWEVENFNHRAVKMFSFCTNIQITNEDKLPKQFCYDCTIKIESAYTYIKKALEVDMTLKNLISRTITSVIVDPSCQFKNILVDDQKSYPDSNMDANIDNKIEIYCFNDLDNINSNHSNDFSEDIKLEMKTSIENCLKTPEMVSVGREKDECQIQDIFETEIKNIDKIKKICPICNKVFMLDKWLKKHMDKHHSSSKGKEDITENDDKKQDKVGEGKQECPLCRKIFTSKLWFSRHIEREHSENKLYFCSHCPTSFPTLHQLRYHQDRHTEERKFACGTCGKRFKKRKQLAKHCVTHGQARPFECDLCHMTFKIKSILTCHMKVHENRKTFLCYICGRSLSSAGNLQQHMAVHSGSRPHACARAGCPYRARSAAALRRHARRHQGDRPQACPRCPKRFYETGSLARHMRTHTGERPFKCPNCELGFLDGWKRKTHMMRVHRLALDEIPRMTRDGRSIEL